MMYETFRLVFVGGAVAAVVMLLVSVFLFIFLRIPAVIGDLTGRTARKAIEDIRNQNEQSGTKTYKSSAVNRQRGKLTDKITPSGRIQKRHTEELGAAMPTSKISVETTVLPARVITVETEVLDHQIFTSEETTVLENTIPTEETTVLNDAYESGSNSNETTVLTPQIDGGAFAVEFEITYIHTSEIIY